MIDIENERGVKTSFARLIDEVEASIDQINIGKQITPLLNREIKFFKLKHQKPGGRICRTVHRCKQTPDFITVEKIDPIPKVELRHKIRGFMIPDLSNHFTSQTQRYRMIRRWWGWCAGQTKRTANGWRISPFVLSYEKRALLGGIFAVNQTGGSLSVTYARVYLRDRDGSPVRKCLDRSKKKVGDVEVRAEHPTSWLDSRFELS